MNLRILFIGLFVGLMVSCSPKPTHEQAKDSEIKEKTTSKATIQNFLITNKAAGDFKIGNEIVFPSDKDNFTIDAEVITKMAEGYEEKETVYTVSEKNTKLLLLKVSDDFKTGEASKIINEILISSEKFKTSEGIGVGSTINEFIAKYPAYKIWYTYVSDMYVLETGGVNAQFLLNESDFTGKLNITSDQEFLKKTDFKLTAKIAEIRIL